MILRCKLELGLATHSVFKSTRMNNTLLASRGDDVTVVSCVAVFWKLVHMLLAICYCALNYYVNIVHDTNNQFYVLLNV